MTVVEFSSQSWWSRIREAIGGVVLGLLLFLVSFPILFWNEGNAVRTAKSLEEGAGAVISVRADSVDAANQGKLVHLQGTATPQGTLTDPQFGISVAALKLDRSVEMYQWDEEKKEEKEKKVGGSVETKTTYTYNKKWSSSVENSGSFKERAGHENPGSFPVSAAEYRASAVTLGAFSMPANLVERVHAAETIPVTDAMLGQVSAEFRGRVKAAGNGFYLGMNPGSPQVGDVRISFKVVRPTAVSVVAQQSGNSLVPYQAKAGGSVELLEVGTVDAAKMFQGAQAANATMTWILRLLGFLFMALGIYLVLRPVAVLGDVIPFIGSFLAFGAGMFALAMSATLSLVTIAMGWIFYRPVLGVLLLLLGVGAFLGFKGMMHRRAVLKSVGG